MDARTSALTSAAMELIAASRASVELTNQLLDGSQNLLVSSTELLEQTKLFATAPEFPPAVIIER